MSKAKAMSGPAGIDAPFSRGLKRTPEFDRAWAAARERREVGRMLERMRRSSEQTQAALAEKMGKDQAFISRMESGRGPMPKAQHIALWAKHCGFMTAYAFVRRDNGDDGLRIDELMPIAQDEDESAELVTLRGVVLPQVELAGAGGEE